MMPRVVEIPIWAGLLPPLDAAGPAFVGVRVTLGLREWYTDLLVDTGASRTMLAVTDAEELLREDYGEIDFERDPRRIAVRGIVGVQRCVERDAVLVFRTSEDTWHEVSAPILIPESIYTAAGTRQSSPLNGLLGRDILGRGALSLTWQLPRELHFTNLPSAPSALR